MVCQFSRGFNPEKRVFSVLLFIKEAYTRKSNHFATKIIII